MINNIIDKLNMIDHYGQSELIEIAKGKYKEPTTFKERLKQKIRLRKWRKLEK